MDLVTALTKLLIGIGLLHLPLLYVAAGYNRYTSSAISPNEYTVILV